MEEEIKVCCATWNMADAPPQWDLDSLEQWLPKGQDIYAIACQVGNSL